MAPEPEANSKGGGQRGGPRRWDGGGPRPARHIPWPELFKHHQSNLTGHLKMMDMVRKHCVPGSGNYQAAQACVDRTHEMLRMFKEATRNFVPPRDSIDRVPLGASSASMYPGYSPADHIYGEASAEYGAMIAEARRQGKEIKSDPDGIEYVVGQSHLSAREQLEEVRKSFAAKKAKERGETSTGKEQDRENGEPMEGVEQTADASQLFVIDSNPTPISNVQNKSPSKGKNKANDKAKRRGSSHEEQSNTTEDAPEHSHKKKKAKFATGEEGKIESKPLVEEDDISAEVDRRLKEKEERRRRKMEKKRKRESGSSQVEVVEETNVPAEEVHAQKPEKKKHKIDKNSEETKEAAAAASEERKSKKEKKKKRSSTAGEAEEESGRAAESDKPKKKRKKEPEEVTE